MTSTQQPVQPDRLLNELARLLDKPVRPQKPAMPTLSQTLRGLKEAIAQQHDSMRSVECIYRGLGRFEVQGKPGMRAHLQNPEGYSRSFRCGEVYKMDIVDVRTANHGRGLVRFDLLLDPEGPRARIRQAALARG